MRPASTSRLTSPIVAEAVPRALVIASTRLSTPPQFGSRSPGALCSLATPVGRRSETTTATPLAASARAVELPMPIGLPQPVISATRDDWGMGQTSFSAAGETAPTRLASLPTLPRLHGRDYRPHPPPTCSLPPNRGGAGGG